jgi:cell division protein FtsA
MDHGEIITAIDIGSSKIKTVIGTFDSEGKLRVLGLGISQSHGIRKGTILDMDQFKKDVDASLAEAERMTGEQISHVILSLSGSSLETYTNSGIVAVPSGEVTEEDVSRALEMSQNGMDLVNRVVLKVIPETFKLDHESGVKNPVGMSAKKLEVRSHIFTVAENPLNNIKKAIYDIGVEIVDVFPNALSASESVLSRRQKELGCLCLEIGSTNSGYCVYEEGVLIASGVLPVG